MSWSYCGGCGYGAEDHSNHKCRGQVCSRCGTTKHEWALGCTCRAPVVTFAEYDRSVAARRRAEAPLRVTIEERIGR